MTKEQLAELGLKSMAQRSLNLAKIYLVRNAQKKFLKDNGFRNPEDSDEITEAKELYANGDYSGTIELLKIYK